MSRETYKDRCDWQSAEAWNASRDYIPDAPKWQAHDESPGNEDFSAEHDGSSDGCLGIEDSSEVQS